MLALPDLAIAFHVAYRPLYTKCLVAAFDPFPVIFYDISELNNATAARNAMAAALIIGPAFHWSRLPLEVRQQNLFQALEHQFREILERNFYHSSHRYSTWDVCMDTALKFGFTELVQPPESVVALIES